MYTQSGMGRRKRLVERLLLGIGLLLFFYVLSPSTVLSADTDSPQVIRVAFPEQSGLSEVDEYGNLSGYTYDYLQHLAQFTGWEYEFITFDDMDIDTALMTSLEMVQNGEADLIGAMLYSDALTEQFAYPDLNYGVVYTTLSVLAGNANLNETNFMLYQPLRIAVPETATTRRQELKKQMDSIGVSYEEVLCADPEAQYQALVDDRADALLRVSLSFVPGTRQILQFAPRPYYLVGTPGNTELIQQLDEATRQVSENYPYLQTNLFQKYFGDSSGNFTLTEEDRAFLKENNTIHALYLTHDAPYSMQKDGKPAGILVSLLDDFASENDLTVEYTPIESLQELKAITSSENSYDFVLGALFYIENNAQYGLITTNTVVNADILQFSKRSAKSKPLSESVVALRKGCSMEQYLKDVNEIRYYDSIEECVLAVNRGDCDCGFGDNYCVEFASEKYACNLVTIPFYGHEQEAQLDMLNTGRLGFLSIFNRYINNLSAANLHTYMTNAKSTLAVGGLGYFIQTNPLAFVTVLALIIVLLLLCVIMFFFTRRLRKNNVQLSLANSAKSDFLSRISHDMRTPLNGILGLTDLMREKKDVSEIHTDLAQLEMSGKYLLNLINDTLDVSKIEHGQMELHPVVCSGKEVLKNALELLRPNLVEKQIQFHLNLEPFPFDTLFIDIGRLEQLIINILGNAVKFTPKHGSIDFTLKNLSFEDGIITSQITVRDNGIGMSEAFIATIFEPFTQEHSCTTGRLQGTGLGMTISKQIVGLMGGVITVKSTEGEGTEVTFTLHFPTATPEQITQSKTHNGLTADLSLLPGKRILLCEDHPLNAQIASRMLIRKEMLVEHAPDGQAGVRMFEASAPDYYDAILMDIRMPILNGLEASRQIRALDRPDAKSIPIIAMTANAFDEDVEECLAAGMDDHLAKPTEPQLLYDKLAKYIALKKRGESPQGGV